MRVSILPSVAEGNIQAPPSKSASHRALIAGALSRQSVIHNLGDSNDINATLSCLEIMGADIKKDGEIIYIGGLDPKNIPECTVDCGESGSTLRFLIPLCLMSGKPVTLKGHGRLLKRPLTEYEQLCREQGFEYVLKDDYLRVCGKLSGGYYRINGERSSQFITGMMFALALVDDACALEITGNAQSLSYIMLTRQIMQDFGIVMSGKDNIFTFAGGQKYQSRDFTVEGDYSNAAFADAFNLTGGRVNVTGLKEDSVQGDKVYRRYYSYLGTDRVMDMSDCPDLAPVLFALAGIYGGKFTGTARLRLKESDRIDAMKSELEKCGIVLLESDNDVEIFPGDIHPPAEVINAHNDHRIVMAMSVLLSKLGGQIDGAEAVSKSWPTFFSDIQKLGIEVIE